MKKTIAKVGVVGVVLLGLTECHMITAPAVFADEQPTSQTLKLDSHFNIVENIIKPTAFYRGNYEIITTEPWKKPEIASQILSDAELITILKSVGFEGNGLRMAWAIVQKESTSRPYAHNDNPVTGDNSYGLFQINMFRSLEAARLEKYNLEKNEDLFDPYVNAKIAYQISNGGNSWSAWTTYESAKTILSQFPE